MKKFCLYLGLIVFVTFAYSPVSSQATKKPSSSKSKSKKKDKEDPFRLEKFWFGGGLNLRFYQYNLSPSVPGSVFEFGVSPIAGYKLTNWLSVGPRIEFNYFGGRFDNNPQVIKLNSVTYGGGVFTRARFLSFLFAHLEYSTSSSLEITGINTNNRLETNRIWQDHLFLGLGYNPQSEWSYEIYIMYDFLVPNDSPQVPIQYRAGITWNF